MALSQSPTAMEAVLVVGNFSKALEADSLPHGWEPLHFKNIERHTDYQLVKDDNDIVLRAVSDGASSGLIRNIKIDPEKYPILSWRWKITKTFKKGNVRKKDGDDYPARVYITFEYDPERVGFFEKAKFRAVKLLYGEYPPVSALNYIWGSNAPEGTIVPNPYTERAMMIVLKSGNTHTNSWKYEERNIVEDYKKAFGENPPMISGVAVMTDTDNTKETAETYYGDIVFKKK